MGLSQFDAIALLVGVEQLQVVFLWVESGILNRREGGWKRVKARGLSELGFLGLGDGL